jgi:hypothetical protein
MCPWSESGVCFLRLQKTAKAPLHITIREQVKFLQDVDQEKASLSSCNFRA